MQRVRNTYRKSKKKYVFDGKARRENLAFCVKRDIFRHKFTKYDITKRNMRHNLKKQLENTSDSNIIKVDRGTEGKRHVMPVYS